MLGVQNVPKCESRQVSVSFFDFAQLVLSVGAGTLQVWMPIPLQEGDCHGFAVVDERRGEGAAPERNLRPPPQRG